MGRTHMAVAATAYCAYMLPQTLSEVLPWATGLGVAILTSQFPDIDEPRSRIGGYLLPVVPSVLRPICFVLLGAYLVYWGIVNLYWLAIILGVIYLLSVFLKHRESPTHALLGVGAAMYVAHSYEPTFLIPIAIGMGSHLILDILTEGIALFWPIPIRIRIPVTRTNSLVEKVVFYYGSQLALVWLILQAYVLKFFEK